MGVPDDRRPRPPARTEGASPPGLPRPPRGVGQASDNPGVPVWRQQRAPATVPPLRTRHLPPRSGRPECLPAVTSPLRYRRCKRPGPAIRWMTSELWLKGRAWLPEPGGGAWTWGQTSGLVRSPLGSKAAEGERHQVEGRGQGGERPERQGR